MFGSIVVGTDGSDTAKEAVRQATELAKAMGASLHLVSAYEPIGEGRLREERQQVPDDMQWMVNPREDVDATLRRTPPATSRAAGVKVETYAREGDPADAILDVAEEQKADLIVVGNKGMTGAKRFLLGSVPNKVSHHAPCSVMIIRYHLAQGGSRIHEAVPVTGVVPVGAEVACRALVGASATRPGLRALAEPLRRRSRAPRSPTRAAPPSTCPGSRPAARTRAGCARRSAGRCRARSAPGGSTARRAGCRRWRRRCRRPGATRSRPLPEFE